MIVSHRIGINIFQARIKLLRCQIHNRRYHSLYNLSFSKLHEVSFQLSRWSRQEDCISGITVRPKILSTRAGKPSTRGLPGFFRHTDPKGGNCDSLLSILPDTRMNHRVPMTSGVMAEESTLPIRNRDSLEHEWCSLTKEYHLRSFRIESTSAVPGIMHMNS